MCIGTRTGIGTSIGTPPPGGFLRQRFSLKILDTPPPLKKGMLRPCRYMFTDTCYLYLLMYQYVSSHASVCAVDVDFAMLQVTGSQCL